MDKSCADRVWEIQEYLDRKLDCEIRGVPYINPELQEHLSGCARCRREMTRQQELLNGLADLEIFEPADDFTALVMARAAQEAHAAQATQANKPAERRLPPWGLLVGTGLLILSSLVLAFVGYVGYMVVGGLDLVESLAEKATLSVVKLSLGIFYFVRGLTGIFFSMLKVLTELAAAYPGTFAIFVLAAALLFVVLIRQIGRTRQKISAEI